MKNQKVNGYVFITVTVIVTILVSTLTVAISGQNKSIELIQNYEKLSFYMHINCNYNNKILFITLDEC